MKVCVVASCGGHLTEIRALRRAYAEYEYFYVVNERIPPAQDMVGRTYFISHAERNILVLKNIVEAWRIVRSERPNVILTAGAGPAVPFAIVAKLFGIAVVYIETWTRVATPSLTGRIMYRLADHFFFQWPQLAAVFPKGKLIDHLL